MLICILFENCPSLYEGNDRDTVYRSCHRCLYFDIEGVNMERSIQSFSFALSDEILWRNQVQPL